MVRLCIATTNQGKQREFSDLLCDWPGEIVCPRDIGIDIEVEEPVEEPEPETAPSPDQSLAKVLVLASSTPVAWPQQIVPVIAAPTPNCHIL